MPTVSPTKKEIPADCPIDPELLQERRKEGWTLWREIYGTVLGTLPFIIGIMVAWMSMSERVRVLEVNHESYKLTVATEHAGFRATLDARDKQIERDRDQIMKALDKISLQIEALQERRR